MSADPHALQAGLDLRDTRASVLAPLFLRMYRVRRLRPLAITLARRCEGRAYRSATLRRILYAFHGVCAGAYSYGEGLNPGAFPPGVTIGRYVSIANDVRVYLRNHPLERLSLHPFFYNADFGYVENDNIPGGTLFIGDDAWVGERAIITPGCSRIGVGSVVGAGAVVTRDVDDFAVVAGNPARLIRYRFDERTRAMVLASRWWEQPVEVCAKFLPDMVRALGARASEHPLLRHVVEPAKAETQS